MQVSGKQCVEVERGGADVTSWLRMGWTLRHCWCAMCRGLVSVRMCMRAGHKCGWWVCTRAYSLCAWWVRAHVSSMCKHPMWACTRVHSSCVGVFCLCVHTLRACARRRASRTGSGTGAAALSAWATESGPLVSLCVCKVPCVLTRIVCWCALAALHLCVLSNTTCVLCCRLSPLLR